MTNTTKTFWSVDGISLQTYAWNITSLGGDRQAPPPLRGDDITVPYMPGDRWVPREVDSRTITLGMWVQGSNEDGTIPQNETQRHVWERNWQKLRRLLWKPRRQMVLTKHFWVPTFDLFDAGVDASLLPSESTWSLYSASAKVNFVGGLAPTMQGGGHSAFTVDLKLTDPYFYSEPIEITFGGNLVTGQTNEVIILGDDRTHAVELEFIGPLSSPMIENLSATDAYGDSLSLWTRYTAEIAAAERAEVNVKKFSARQLTAGEPFKSSGFVRHGGDKPWFWLEPGETILEMSAQAGTGTGKLTYRPAWI